MADMKNCPYCGKLTDLSLKNCPHCGGPFQAKAPETPSMAPALTGNSCPICKAKVQDGDIICVRCGTNLLTGEKVVSNAPMKIVEERDSGTRMMLAIAAVLVCVLAAGGVAAYYLLRDPVALAVKEFNAGNPMGAIQNLEHYTQRRGDDTHALMTLGKMQWKNESYAQAATLFDTVSKAQPENTDAAMLAVVAQARVLSNPDRAAQRAALERVVKNDPANVEAKYLLALSPEENANPEEQTTALESVASSGDNAAAYRELGMTNILQGNKEGAKSALEKAKAAANDGDTDLALGIVASSENDTQGAISLMTNALEKGTNDDTLAKLRLAVEFLKEGNPEGALPLARAAAEGLPSNNLAAFVHAMSLEAAGLDNEALTAYDKILNANTPYTVDAASRMASLLANQGNYERALTLVGKAKEAGGASAYLYTLEGRIHFATGALADAQESFRNAIKSDPDYAQAHLENGLLYVKREVLSDGIKELERYLALVGDKREGTRANEIEVLLTQLRQTMGEKTAPKTTH